jgi:hypothetical protein
LQLAVDVKGQRDGTKYHHKMWTESPNIVQACDKITGTNDVSWITSIPASIASLMLLRAQIQLPGGDRNRDVAGRPQHRLVVPIAARAG